MVEKTFSSMRGGDIYDHIGFGFHRYSTDHTWVLPHFEKMLLAIRSRFIPKKVIILRPVENAKDIDSITGFTEYQDIIGGKATAYVCQNHACKSPTTDVDEMLELLR